MTGKALICRLEKQKEIFGADRIAQVTMFGETVIVSKDYKEGMIGLLFDCETQLSHEYASANNLYRNKELNKDKTKKGYLGNNRRIKPIVLKEVQCSAMFMPIESLSFISTDTGKYPRVGQEIESFDGIPICSKYIPLDLSEIKSLSKKGQGTLRLKAKTFKNHFKTDQWGRNYHKLKEGDFVIITEKIHGTAGVCGYLPVKTKLNWWQKFCFFLTDLKWGRTLSHYEFIAGSKRLITFINNNFNGVDERYNQSVYANVAKKYFKGKLRKGESVYYEITGFYPNGLPIMGSHSNEKLKKFMSKSEYKEFIDRYGKTTEFTYGCSNYVQPQTKNYIVDETKESFPQPTIISYPNFEKTINNRVFIYRITMTNDDGKSIDLSWQQVKTRSKQLGVAHVPELYVGFPYNPKANPIEKNENALKHLVENFTESDSKNFPQHINEGVCVRIENGSLTPQIYKSKRFLFKVLENIIKDNPDNIDVEETN